MQSKKIMLLENHWLFSNLTSEEINSTAKNLKQKNFQSGEFIFFQGDESNQLYFVVEGEVSIEVVSINGHTTILATLFNNEIFGEFALIDDMPRSASARALMQTELYFLEKAHFLDLVIHNPKFSLALARGLVSRLRYTNRQIETLNTLPLKKRVLSALLGLTQELEGAVIKITQSQLADRVSASREKVNVSLKSLERQSLISTGRGQIELHDIPRMRLWLDS